MNTLSKDPIPVSGDINRREGAGASESVAVGSLTKSALKRQGRSGPRATGCRTGLGPGRSPDGGLAGVCREVTEREDLL